MLKIESHASFLPSNIRDSISKFNLEMSDNRIPREQPKKVRLPSISSIASSLPQPLSSIGSITTNNTHLPNRSSSLSNVSDLEHKEIPNKLKVAAEIFSGTEKLKDQPIKESSVSPSSTPLKHPSTYYSPVYQPSTVYTTQPTPPQPTQTHSQPQPQLHTQEASAPQLNQQQYYTAQYPYHSTYIPLNPQPYYSHYTTTPLVQNQQQQQQQQHDTSYPRANKRNGQFRRSSKSQERKIKPNISCQRCGITDTPEWRKGPNGARTLCNACGLFHAKILKKEGPEAAARAIIQTNKIRKKTIQRRSINALNDPILINQALVNGEQHIPFQTGPYNPGYAQIGYQHIPQIAVQTHHGIISPNVSATPTTTSTSITGPPQPIHAFQPHQVPQQTTQGHPGGHHQIPAYYQQVPIAYIPGPAAVNYQHATNVLRPNAEFLRSPVVSSEDDKK